MIAIDLRYLNTSNSCLTNGVDIFAKELIDGFCVDFSDREFILICYSHQEEKIKRFFPNIKTFTVDSPISKFIRVFTNKKYGFERTFLKLGIYNKRISDLDIDCLWLPFAIPENELRISEFDKIPKIYTLHDLIMHHQITKYGEDSNYQSMISRCNSLVTISNYVMNDVVYTFGEICTNRFVVPNAVTMDCSLQEPIDNLIDKGYILDINAFQERKNAETLIRAYQLIKDCIKHDLVLCGGWKDDAYYDRLNYLINELGLTDRVHMFCAVSTDKRNWLLNNASLFVTPSLSEGFGRTPIEAAMNRIPVISSTSDSLQEATLNLVNYYFDAMDEIELSKVILKVIQSPPSHKQLEIIATTLTREYSISNIAKQYMDIFDKVIKDNLQKH